MTDPMTPQPCQHACNFGAVKRAEDGQLSYDCVLCGQHIVTSYYFRATEPPCIHPQRLRVGDIVKLSALAIQQGWYPIERVRIEPDQIRGVVTKTPNTGSVYVRWNLYKTSEHYPQVKVHIGLEKVMP